MTTEETKGGCSASASTEELEGETRQKPMWQICMENAEQVEKYDFSHLALEKMPTKPCARCDGTGYRKQPPGYYGLCECTSCGGTGKMIGKPSNAEVTGRASAACEGPR